MHANTVIDDTVNADTMTSYTIYYFKTKPISVWNWAKIFLLRVRIENQEQYKTRTKNLTTRRQFFLTFYWYYFCHKKNGNGREKEQPLNS